MNNPAKAAHPAITYLNERLPKTRCIAQLLITNDDGKVLSCELVYKRWWDLPGGVVDPGESPAQAARREMREELGVEVQITGLQIVSWLPPWRGWDDALLFVFSARLENPEQLVISSPEIKDFHWLSATEIPEKMAEYTALVVEKARECKPGETYYLENGRPPGEG